MHEITIYRKEEVFVTLKLEGDSKQVKEIMGRNELQLKFYLSYSAEFDINDWCTVFDEVYKINVLPVVTKLAKDRFEYGLVMVSESFDLAKANYLFLGSNNTLNQPDFSLIGTALDFLNLIIQNISRIQEGWSIGQVMLTDTRNMTFSTVNCYNALGQIAQEFELEFFLEGKVIHLTKRLRPTPYVLMYGKGYGLTEIKRMAVDSTNVITRLYGYGSDKNLPVDYRNYTATRLQFGNIPYMDYNTQRYGVIESTKIWDDIFPTRTGTVSATSAVSVYRFTDTSMDFDLNDYLLPNATAKVNFITGQLAGYTFEVKKYENAVKEFTLLANMDEKAYEDGLPNNLLGITLGDKYVLTDIFLPDSYILEAETRLLNATMEQLKYAAVPRVTYRVNFDQAYLKKNNIVLKIGETARIIDEQLNLDRQIRITVTSRNLVNEYDMELEFSDALRGNPISAMRYDINSNTSAVNNLNSAVNNNAVINKSITGDFKIAQGTLIFDVAAIEVINDITDHAQLVLDMNTGKIKIFQ